MGSKTFDGVWFTSNSHVHLPPHVHGQYAGVEVIIDLLPGGMVRQPRRARAVKPRKVKVNVVRHILVVAAANAAELMKVWEKAHGKTSK